MNDPFLCDVTRRVTNPRDGFDGRDHAVRDHGDYRTAGRCIHCGEFCDWSWLMSMWFRSPYIIDARP